MRLSRGSVAAWVLFFAFLLCSGCTSAIAPYDHYAYLQATSLKVEALELLDNAVEPYSMHVEEVRSFKQRMQKAYEYVRALPKNDLTRRQYEILMNPQGHSLFGVLNRWESSGRLSPAFVHQIRPQIAAHFDQVIALEAAKIKRFP